MRILVTGGTGALGSQVVTRLLASDHQVRVMSRRSNPPVPEGVESVQGNLAGDDSFDGALMGVDAVVHCATSFSSRRADAEGTGRLLQAAKRGEIWNFVFPSIVGIDRDPIGNYPYYRVKRETEGVIEASRVPSTILRVTQFHTLVLRVLRASDRLPWQTVLRDFRAQLIDAGEVAGQLVAAVEGPALGRLPDIAGPDELTLEQAARAYLRHKGSRKPLLRIPIGVGFGKGFVAGQNLAPPDRQVGKVSWEDFLRTTFAA